MNISQIKQYPTSINTVPSDNRTVLNSCHESYFRSYQTLQKVKELLEQNTHQKVVLEIIHDIETSPEIVK